MSKQKTVLPKVLSTDTVTRITTPNGTPGIADGLGFGDRQIGYGWSLAERGDYIYIGTWYNTVASVVSVIQGGLAAKGLTLSEDTIWAMADTITNNEIPHPSKGQGGQIFKMHKDKPGVFEKIYETNVSFRNVILYKGDLYFTTYRGGRTDVENFIYKVDANDNVTEVFRTSDGACSRACAILDDELYFATSDSAFKQDEGDEKLARLVVMKKTDDDNWEYVADYKDFGEYTADPFPLSAAASPFWDMVAFKGSLYATIPGTAGYVIYEGHPAKAGEPANQYGWVWTEIAGKHSVNYPGLSDDPEGNINGYGKGILSVVGALGVFKDELYTYNINHTIIAEVIGVSGMLSITQPDFKLSNFVGPLYTCMHNPQKVWKLNEETGRFDECTGFTKYVRNTCVEYVWKSAEYNGEFYISTMNSKVIYNYLTRFFNGALFDMSKEEWAMQCKAVGRLFKSLMNKQTLEMVKGLKAAKAEAPATAPVEKKKFSEKFDDEGRRMYREVNRIIKKDAGGFLLLKTADGKTFEPVTMNGFGDRYNYGLLRYAPTDHGMYMTTANPFFGTQLYLLKNNK